MALTVLAPMNENVFLQILPHTALIQQELLTAQLPDPTPGMGLLAGIVLHAAATRVPGLGLASEARPCLPGFAWRPR